MELTILKYEITSDQEHLNRNIWIVMKEWYYNLQSYTTHDNSTGVVIWRCPLRYQICYLFTPLIDHTFEKYYLFPI